MTVLCESLDDRAADAVRASGDHVRTCHPEKRTTAEALRIPSHEHEPEEEG